MLINGSLHHAAGAVALHGVADLFGGGQTHPGVAAPGLEHIQYQCRVHIGLAAGVHTAKLAVAADRTITHNIGTSFRPGAHRCTL